MLGKTKEKKCIRVQSPGVHKNEKHIENEQIKHHRIIS